jgi:hypothetical protein
MRTSSGINEIAKALNEVQKNIKDVFKGASGFNYKYATLDKVYDEIRPAMTKNGLSLTHQKSFDRTQNVITLTSLLMHTGGQYIEYEASLPYAGLKGMNDYQSAGSGFTYLERYQTSAIFAITSDMDNDGAGAQTITHAQISALEAKIVEVGADRKKLLDYYKVARIADIKPADYNNAIKALEAKK